MKATKRIETPRLTLRKLHADDWFILFKAVTDDRFPIDLPLKERVKTEHDAKMFITDRLQAWKMSRIYTWSIYLKKAPDGMIGQISLTQRSKKNQWGMAFWIAPDCWKSGYAEESVLALTQHFKKEYKSICFRAGAATWNKRSNRLLAKSGFKRTGSKKAGYICNGKEIPIHIYEMSISTP